MNEYLLYLAIGFSILLLALIVPGLKIFAEALLKLLIDFLTELVKHISTFGVWAIKTLASDHMRLLMHATKSRNVIDPTQQIRRKAEGYED